MILLPRADARAAVEEATSWGISAFVAALPLVALAVWINQQTGAESGRQDALLLDLQPLPELTAAAEVAPVASAAIGGLAPPPALSEMPDFTTQNDALPQLETPDRIAPVSDAVEAQPQQPAPLPPRDRPVSLQTEIRAPSIAETLTPEVSETLRTPPVTRPRAAQPLAPQPPTPVRPVPPNEILQRSVTSDTPQPRAAAPTQTPRPQRRVTPAPTQNEPQTARPATAPVVSQNAPETATPSAPTRAGTSQRVSPLERWSIAIRREIEQNMQYPRSAGRVSATVVLQLDVAADGALQGVDVAESSGRADLDRAALRAVAQIREFPQAPSGFTADQQRFLLPLEFVPPGNR